jgi:cephalosporin-C deacetylase-like acetyl esterase
MLGGMDYPKLDLKPTQELVADLPTHRAYRTFLPAFEGVRIYGILLEPKSDAKRGPHPAMIAIHGMSSGPEAVCGLAEKPDYTNNFGLQLVQRGYLVFAPLDINNYKTRSWLDRKAILIGQRLQGIEQFKISRIIDYLSSRPDVDAKRIGAYGISWGGRTVMCAAALDRRIAATAISGHFNDFIPKMVTPSEHYTAFIQTPEDYSFFWSHAKLFTDADVVALICPRPVFIEQGRQDRVAYWEMSQKAFNEVKTIYDKLGVGDRAAYSIFEGPHEIHGKEAFEFFDKWLKK